MSTKYHKLFKQQLSNIESTGITASTIQTTFCKGNKQERENKKIFLYSDSLLSAKSSTPSNLNI